MPSLAIIMPIGPGHQKLSREALQSIKKAASKSRVFDKVQPITVDDSKAQLGRSKARNQAIEQAIQEGYDWIYFLDADDIMHDQALNEVGKHLDRYDAIWGAIVEFQHGEKRVHFRPNQIQSCNSIKELLLTDPFLSIQMGFFAKASCFQNLRFDESMDTGEDFKVYLELWSQFNCVKIEAPFFMNRRGAHSEGPRSATGGQWRSTVSKLFGEKCLELRLTSAFDYFGKNIEFAISNPLDLIQQSHINRRFFEELELFAVQTLFERGGNIIDAGSNIGNHTVFFSQFYGANRVYCFECNPEAINLLEKNLDLNRCENVDRKYLGIGLSETPHQGTLNESQADNLGATSFRQSKTGEIEFKPLDSLELDNIKLLKVDCEGMDLKVIMGAKQIIARDKPVIFFECFNEQYELAREVMADLSYDILHEFKYVYSKNIIAVAKL